MAQFDNNQQAYRRATERHVSKMVGVTLGGRRYCKTCKEWRPLDAGYKRLPEFKCSRCVRGETK